MRKIPETGFPEVMKKTKQDTGGGDTGRVEEGDLR